jgi:hypothetical protein
MPRREDDPNDQLFEYSERLLHESRHLREVSKRLLAHIRDLHELERQSRTVPMGSPEFTRLSADITTLSREVFRLSEEQEAVGGRIPEQSTTVEDMDSLDENRPRSPSV